MVGPLKGKALAAAAIALGALALALGGTALAKPGDVYVSSNDGVEGVYKTGRAGGVGTALTTDMAFGEPFGMVMLPNTHLLVADFQADAIFDVNTRTGATSTFISGAAIGAPSDLALGADGFLYVSDLDGGPGNAGRVLRVNRRTKAVTEVFSGAPLEDPFGIAVTRRRGTIFVSDESGAEVIYRIAPGGAPVAFDGTPAVGNAEDLALSPDERFLYATDLAGALSRMRLSDGAVTSLAPLDDPRGLALLSNGSFLVSDRTNDLVNRVTPGATPPATTFITNPDWSFPAGVVVEPPRCGGKLATIVGTTKRDKLRGSRFADIIVGLGGNDVIRGLGGKDVICGGKGRDRLFGGKGRDRLFGGKGRDRLIGGPGRDRQRQ